MDETLERDIRAYGAERGFQRQTVDRWLQLSGADAAAIWELTRDLRLGENQLRDLWEWSEEIAARDGSTLATVLALEPVRLARRTAGGRNDRLKALKAALRRLRFPALTKTQDRINALIASLGLPAGVRLSVADLLEGDDLRAEIVARDPAGLEAGARALADAAATPACEEIFELLSGASSNRSDRTRGAAKRHS
jgi:hypothetical protein